jgi:LmbE family N-acetylglucosaminyl deacetylase
VKDIITEVCAAADLLGLEEAAFLGYEDGKLDQADADEAIAKIVAHLRRVRPDVLVTFDPNGSYGHLDHIAICLLGAGLASHRLSPLPAPRLRSVNEPAGRAAQTFVRHPIVLSRLQPGEWGPGGGAGFVCRFARIENGN